MASPTDKMELARRHLQRVQAAWDDPTDWADLSFYVCTPLKLLLMLLSYVLVRRYNQYTGIGQKQRSNCLLNMDLMMSPSSFAISMKFERTKRMETS